MKSLFRVLCISLILITQFSCVKEKIETPISPEEPEITRGTLLHTFQGIFGNMIAHWSPDGTKVATACGIQSATIWSATTGLALFTLREEYSYGIVNIEWSPDGKKVATASDYGTVLIWSSETGTKIFNLSDQGRIGGLLKWSPDGTKLATFYGVDSGIVYSTLTGKRLFAFGGHKNFMTDLNWSPDGTKLATSASDKLVIVWSGLNGERLLTLKGHNDEVLNVRWNTDGTKISSGGYDRNVRIWSSSSGINLYSIGNKYYNEAWDWCPDGKKLAIADIGRDIALRDVNSGDYIYGLIGHTDDINDIQWNSTGTRIASSSYDSTTKIWDAIGLRNTLTLKQNGVVFTVEWNKDETKVLTTCMDNTAKIWYVGK